MQNLKDVLEELKQTWLLAGVSATTRKALRTHRQRRFRALIVAVLGLAVLLGTATWLLLTQGSQTAKIFVGLAGIGGGGGVSAYILRIWKDWSQTDLLLILIEDAPEAQVTALIEKLIRKT